MSSQPILDGGAETLTVAETTPEGNPDMEVIAVDTAVSTPVIADTPVSTGTFDDLTVTIEPPVAASTEVVEPKAKDNEETTTNTATLIDSEKEELAAYRRQDKLSLIASFKETIPEEELTAYISKVDEYSKELLQNALNAAFVRNFKNGSQPTIGFSWAPEQKPSSDISEEDRIAQEMRERRKNRGNE